MSTANVATLLVTYCAVTAVMLVTWAARATGRERWLHAVFGLCMLAVAVAAASLALQGQNSITYFFKTIARLDRPHLAAVALGVFLALLAGLALQAAAATPGRRFLVAAVYAASVAVLAVLTSRELISSVLVKPNAASGSLTIFEKSLPPGFRLEEVASLSFVPTSLAMGPDEHLYVAGYAGLAYQNGVVVRLDRASPAGPYRETGVADYLNRPHGIAFHEGDLYISRAGQYTRAVEGRIVQENTGAVTRAKDLDGNGKYDYYADVLSGLPGAQQPDGLHQNNGVAFDSSGYVYVTVGYPTDRGPSNHPYAGTILRARPDGSELSVFARGLRNPYDVVIGPDDALFCTDNDPDATNPGDALYHVVLDSHFGFPYTALGTRVQVTGARKPLLRSTTALEGLTYVPAGQFPAGYDDCLYVASFGDGHINRVRLERDGDTYRATMDMFARVPAVLDVTFAGGALYACSYDERKIYRVLPE